LASTVYTVEEVALLDDSTVTLKPLSIKNLRVFMKYIDAFGTAKTEEEGLAALLTAAALCVQRERPEFWDEEKAPLTEELPKGGYVEDLFEDVFDMDTVYRVLKVCGGVELNNPEILRAAAEALGATSTSQN
jgi:hypothetical protein